MFLDERPFDYNNPEGLAIVDKAKDLIINLKQMPEYDKLINAREALFENKISFTNFLLMKQEQLDFYVDKLMTNPFDLREDENSRELDRTYDIIKGDELIANYIEAEHNFNRIIREIYGVWENELGSLVGGSFFNKNLN